MKQKGLKVKEVISGSISYQMGIEPGDRLIKINNRFVRDIIDYKFLICEEKLTVLLVKASGESWILDIEKDYEEDLGLDFGADGLGKIMRCQNSCIFCFLKQMPKGMRSTLYFNDDDYRLSFINGNFITLTNVSKQDLKRIARQRLSPLYISVHTTNPGLRKKMMNNLKAARIMEQLIFLSNAGVKVHAQAVLCPGINDGTELEKTIIDLFNLWPGVSSLAVVPVGLTCYRKGLYPLRLYVKSEAQRIIKLVEKWQDVFKQECGYPFVFASDEFYLLAGFSIPSTKSYAGFPQVENGVGLVRLFLDEWNEVEKTLPLKLPSPKKVTIVTGVLAESILLPVVERLNQIKNLKVNLYAIKNSFFGEEVTVAGLLTAGDLLNSLIGREMGDLLVLPEAMLRTGDLISLDDVGVNELAHQLNVPIAVAGGPEELIRKVLS